MERVKVVDGITVRIHGEITEDIKRSYSKRLAIILLKQYGPEFCKAILKEIKTGKVEKAS